TMTRDLGMLSQQFGLAVGIFFAGYLLLQVPSNLMLHRVGGQYWIAAILIASGGVAAATGLVRSVPELYLARFLLGLTQSGFFPGVLLYLTYWFNQRENAKAIAIFMTAMPVTSILGAPLSGYILDEVHWFGMASWRWLLMLQGLPAILGGVVIFFALPSRPE